MRDLVLAIAVLLAAVPLAPACTYHGTYHGTANCNLPLPSAAELAVCVGRIVMEHCLMLIQPARLPADCSTVPSQGCGRPMPTPALPHACSPCVPAQRSAQRWQAARS